MFPSTTPSQVINDLFQGDLNGFPSIVTQHFRRVLINTDQIPVLDANHPPDSFGDRELVLFHGMVQDTSLSPELYLAKRKNGESGGWGMADEDDDRSGDVPYADLRECSTFWVVSIPGQSAWCATGNQASTTTMDPHRPPQPHKYPIPGAAHIGIQVKIYDEQLAQFLRTTDIASFVGILTSEPLHASLDLPSPIIVPTLHVLFSNPLPSTIIPRSFPDLTLLPTIKAHREMLISWIANEGLAGDHNAAEWVLLCTIARVRARHPPILPPSLTISRFPAPADKLASTPALCHVLSQILPLVSTIPLSLTTLNETPFCPESKDEDLHSGWLQHPKGATLVLTEGAVTEGGIFNKGVMNIRATQEMMEAQSLEYVFPFSNFRFETDVSFLVTTEGEKSTFFKTDINVPLRPNESADARQSLYKAPNAISLPSEDILLTFRQLVGSAKIGNVTIGEGTAKYIEEDFVQERVKAENTGTSGGGFTADDLIRRMSVARLIALSLHQSEVTIDSWVRAKELEVQINTVNFGML
ncbi:hypothetical protein B0H34DRAFT_694085, partial [Crassisporium funariophilum]